MRAKFVILIFLVLVFASTSVLAQEGVLVSYDLIYTNLQLDEDRLLVSNGDGSNAREVETPVNMYGRISWSADGRYMAIEGTDSESWGLFIYDTGTEQSVKISDKNEYYHDPAWASTSNTLAFVRQMPTGASIWTYSVESEEVSRISEDYVFVQEPSWSGNDDQIAYMCGPVDWTRLDRDIPATTDICMSDLTTGQDSLLTQNNQAEANPFWIGTQFAWITLLGANISELATSSSTLYSGNIDIEANLKYQDHSIVLTEIYDSINRQVLVITLDELKRVQRTEYIPLPEGIRDGANGDISPDNRYIAYQVIQGPTSQILVWDRDNNVTITVASGEEAMDYFFSPRWRPRPDSN